MEKGEKRERRSYTQEFKLEAVRLVRTGISKARVARDLGLHLNDDYGAQELIGLGYGLLHAKRAADAIEIFKLSVEAAPDYYNSYDSLAEAYMVHGDKQLAIENYQKSLQLDPGNKNAVAKLKELNTP